MRRAQITVFMVLGIVVLIIFGLVYFISRQSSDAVLEKKVNKVYSDFLSSTNIKNVVNDCLDRSTKDALLLVGLQGGRIYDYQIEGGYHITSFYDVIPYNYTTSRNPNGTIYNVSYGIKAVKSQRAGAPPIDPPDYPYNGSLIAYVSATMPDFFVNPNNQLFADVGDPSRFTILPDLCNKVGPNDPYTAGAAINCETYSPKNESIQEYIKKYIEQNVQDCINLTLKENLGYNISGGEMSLSVLIGEDDILVSLSYPIEISIKNKPPITRYIDFNMRPAIRLKTLHEIALHLIGFNPPTIKTYAESNNIFFDILKDDPHDCYGRRSSCIIDGISLFKLPDYCLYNYTCNFDGRHYNYSDILVIEDKKSVIDGMPYRLQFAIENRRPALDLIDENVDPDGDYYKYVNSTYGYNLTELYSNNGIGGHPSSGGYNILVKSGNSVEIYPLGVDPDEEHLDYSYNLIQPGGGSIALIPPKDVNFTSGTGDAILLVNVSDNEGLYDYQEVKIKVVP